MKPVHHEIVPVLLALLMSNCALSADSAKGRFGHYEPKQEYPDIVTSSFYLPLRDGVRVAVRVDRPARDGEAVEGKFPVIWQGTLSITEKRNGPRWSGAAPGLWDSWTLTRYGYVVVQVARRGNGQSFGTMRGYHDRNEAEDAYEITQWLASQPWSTGEVGIYGCSNTGDAAMHAMTVRPPALKAVFAGCFSWHKYDAFRRGGIFAQWGTGPTRTIEQDMEQEPVDGDEDKVLLRKAAEQHQQAASLFELWKGMPYRDSYSPLVGSRFWQEGSSANYADQIRRSGAALYILGGWHDELRDQGLITLLNVPGSRILIGPWKHCMNDDFPLLEEAHRFFDHYLKGLNTGIEGSPRIHYYVMNADADTEWRTANEWPLPETRSERTYFSVDGVLEPGPPQSASAPRSFTVKYDVACKDAGTGPFQGGPFAQPCHVDGAGLSFAQAPLDKDTEVTGNPVADLWIAADEPDANVFAYLEDVAPDGTVKSITEGRLKASLRATREAPWKMPVGVPWHRDFEEDTAPLKPGEPVELSFDFMPTSYVFRKGHRIQITVTGADPRERARDETGLARTISVYADPQHNSSVTLPVIPH